MKVQNTAALTSALILSAAIACAAAAHAQSRDSTIFRSLENFGRGSQIGVTVRDVEEADGKTRTGVLVDAVSPGSPAARAGLKPDDAIIEFDGERVRSARQFTRIVQETPAGRSVTAAVSRGGQRIAINVTPEAGALNDEFGLRLLESPNRPTLPPPPAPSRAPRPPALEPAFPFESDGAPFTLLTNRGRLGITMEPLGSQLAGYFGVKEGALVKTVVEGSAAAKAGLKAGDVITAVNGDHVYDPSDVSRALGRMDDGGEFTIELVRDRKTQTLKGKLDPRESRPRTRVRTIT